MKVGQPGGSEAPYRRRFLDEVRGAGIADRLLLPGRVSHDELLAWYSGAQCLVLGSLEEGFALPVLEAMACGCPVIVPDASTQAEVGDSATARFSPATDPDSLAAVIAKVVDDARYREDLRRRGFARAHELSWDRAVERTRAVYESVLATAAEQPASRTPRSIEALAAGGRQPRRRGPAG